MGRINGDNGQLVARMTAGKVPGFLDTRPPYAYFTHRPHATHRLKVGLGLHAIAQQRQDPGIRAGQLAGGGSAGSRGAYGSDRTAIDQRGRRAGIPVEQHDAALYYRQVAARIVGIQAYQLGAKRGRDLARHQAQDSLIVGNRNKRPQRKPDLAPRDCSLRIRHQVYARVHAENAPHPRRVDEGYAAQSTGLSGALPRYSEGP